MNRPHGGSRADKVSRMIRALAPANSLFAEFAFRLAFLRSVFSPGPPLTRASRRTRPKGPPNAMNSKITLNPSTTCRQKAPPPPWGISSQEFRLPEGQPHPPPSQYLQFSTGVLHGITPTNSDQFSQRSPDHPRDTSSAPVRLDTFSTWWLRHHDASPPASRSTARGSA